ncbi:MAG: hypothetical protein E7181_02150 [Erysipelotrichaceae bacterium]|jgi:hypothetical protein|nr:hypothetical protein [Erysipelotrichaceae bacterium]
MKRKTFLIISSIIALLFGSATFAVSHFSVDKQVQTAYAANPISYIYKTWDGIHDSVQSEAKSCDDYEVVTSTKKNWLNGWYVVNNNVSISERIIASGTINLIICDGKTLAANKGIHLSEGATLNIYTQALGTGTIIANGIKSSAGIGGSSLGSNSGAVNIYGGFITSNGGENGAGIGGGNSGNGGTVTIYGGTINTTGGLGASGIGNGNSGGGGTVTVYGGTVNAIGSYPGNGISGTLLIPNNMVVLGNSTQAPTYSDDQQTNYATNRWKYMTIMHVHIWSYVANGNTITASCSSEDCVENEGLTLTVYANNAEYDGDDHKTASIKSEYNTLAFTNPTISYFQNGNPVDECVNAGTYEARVTVGGATAVKQFVIEKAWPMIIQAPQVYDDDHYRYTGNYKYLIIPGSAIVEGGAYYFRVGKNGEFSSDYPQAKDVGTYTVYMKVVGDANHADDDEIYGITFNIMEADSKITTSPKAIGNLVYNQEPQALINAGVATGGTIKYRFEGEESFSDDIPTATNAGEYIIEYYVEADYGYTDSAVFSVRSTIEKGDINPALSLSNWIYNGEPSTPVLTGNNGNGEVIYEYKEVEADDSYYSTDVPTDVGTYTIRATIEETDNYFGGSATCDFSITQATPTDYSKPPYLMASYGDKLSSVILPANWTWKSPDDLVGDAGKREHVAIYNPDDPNYKAIEVTLTVSVSTIVPTDYDIPTNLKGTYGQTLADIDLPSGWTWDKPKTKLDRVGNNYYDAIYTIDDPNYHIAMEVLTVKVEQATPTGYDIPTGLEANSGDKLSSVILPTNWSWKSPDDLVGDAGNREHVAIYTPEDKNYKDVEVSLTVLVKDSSTPTPDPTPGPTPDSNPDSNSYSNPDSSSEPAPDSNPDSSSYSNPDSSSEPTPDSNPDSSSYSNPDSNPKPTPEPPSDNNNNFPVGAIVGIAAGSTVIASTGIFALIWFGIKKKSWADLLAIFKKK